MNNDKRILKLQKQIEIGREELGDEPSSELITDARLRTGTGEWVNLRSTTSEILTSLLVDLNSRRMSALDLDITYTIGGYSIESWIKDIKTRLAHLEYTKELRRFERLENRLDYLLSEEKKKERKIKAIADEI